MTQYFSSLGPETRDDCQTGSEVHRSCVSLVHKFVSLTEKLQEKVLPEQWKLVHKNTNVDFVQCQDSKQESK